jgi:hypothetical protein
VAAGLAWSRLSVGLSFDAVTTGRVDTQGVPLRFDLLAARMEACARWPLLAPKVALEPCLFIEAGSLGAAGSASPPEVTAGSSGSALWLTPGLLLALRAELGPVFLGLEASGGPSLNREHFYLQAPDGQHDVYRVPRFTAGAALAAGVDF